MFFNGKVIGPLFIVYDSEASFHLAISDSVMCSLMQFINVSLSQVKSGDTSAAESGSEVEDIASPKPTGSYLLPKLTPVCEEVSACI